MQGILAAALSPAPPAPERANLPPRLSSFNLARHTTAHPPAPRRTVEQYLASVAPVHAAGAYEVGPPAEDEFDHVRTPPRAVEARRKRRLEDIEDRGESWIRSPARTNEEALVLIRPDSISRSEEGVRAKRATTSQPARKPSLVAAMKGRTSNSAARKASQPHAPQSRPPSPPDAASDRSSVLVPRNPKLADRPFDHAAGPRERDEKENEPGKSQETKRRSGRKAPRADWEETGELEEHEALLRGRRERRRQNALMRKDRSLPAAAVGAAAAARVKKATNGRRGSAAREKGATDSHSEEELEPAQGTRAKRSTREDRSRRKLKGLDRPGHVGGGRLTLKPLGIFSKGKASTRAATAKRRSGGFDEAAFLSGAAEQDAPAQAPSSSSSSEGDIAATRTAARHALRGVLPAPRRTYGSRPSKRRSDSSYRVVLDSSLSAEEEEEHAPAPRSKKNAKDSQQQSSHARSTKQALRPSASARTDPPPFWIDIPVASPRPRTGPLTLRQPDSVCDQSTAASALSAASLARRNAAKKACLRNKQSEVGPPAAEEAIPIVGDSQQDMHSDFGAGVEPEANFEDDFDGALSAPGVDRGFAPASVAETADVERLLAELASPGAAVDPASAAVEMDLQGGAGADSLFTAHDAQPSRALQGGGLALEHGGDDANFTANYSPEVPVETIPTYHDTAQHHFYSPFDSNAQHQGVRGARASNVSDIPAAFVSYGAGDDAFDLGTGSLDEPLGIDGAAMPYQHRFAAGPERHEALNDTLVNDAAFRDAMRRQWPKTTL